MDVSLFNAAYSGLARLVFTTWMPAMAGNGALFTHRDAVEAAGAIVTQALKNDHRVRPYGRHSRGPKEPDALIAADGSWHNPILGRT
jgi:glucose-6-phosphate 1-dehydrogenase